MKVTKDSSQTLHTVTIELTTREVNQLGIDRNALKAGFPALVELVRAIEDAVQQKPTSRRPASYEVEIPELR